LSQEDARRWLERSPYARALGAEPLAVAPEAVRLRLPFRADNTNPGGVLHGGVAASLIALAGQAVARATLGPEAAPFHSGGLEVAYLAAAREEAVEVEATRLREGKELVFVDVAVRGADGRPIAQGLVAARGRFGAPAVAPPSAAGDDGAADPGPLGPHIERIPFMARLGIRIEHMHGGRSRIVLPFRPEHADGDDGAGVAEGAVLALLDTTGAMAAWAVTGPGPYKASTPALQAQFLAPAPAESLVAHGRCVHRDGGAFWSDVEVCGAESRTVCARGTVLYRILA
jgi:uncharacterized protein (TIGR00369 family)